MISLPAGGGNPLTVAVFTSRQAIQIAGVSQRQLAYWRKIGLIVPSQFTPGGHSRYNFADLLALKAAKRLIDAGVSLQKIRASIGKLVRILPELKEPLVSLSLVATGDIILVFHEGAAFEALSGQEWIFPIAQLQHEIERAYPSGKESADRQGELFPELHSGGKGAHRKIPEITRKVQQTMTAGHRSSK